jgi:hypothetical protein
MDAARDPAKLIADSGIKHVALDETVAAREARAFALGWIEARVRVMLGAEAPTTGWLAGHVLTSFSLHPEDK